MSAKLKFGSVGITLVCIGVGATIDDASAAPSADVAKKCAALTAKAFPPRVAGNPAAGSARGPGQSEQSYFSKCVANGGNVDELCSQGVPNPSARRSAR
jgi:hypothetical protein